MFTWFLKEIPKEKHILNIEKNSLKSSLDILILGSSITQWLQKKLCSFSAPLKAS